MLFWNSTARAAMSRSSLMKLFIWSLAWEMTTFLSWKSGSYVYWESVHSLFILRRNLKTSSVLPSWWLCLEWENSAELHTLFLLKLLADTFLVMFQQLLHSCNDRSCHGHIVELKKKKKQSEKENNHASITFQDIDREKDQDFCTC